MVHLERLSRDLSNEYQYHWIMMSSENFDLHFVRTNVDIYPLRVIALGYF